MLASEKKGLLPTRFYDILAPDGACLSIDNCPGVCEEDQNLRMCFDVTAQPLVDILGMTVVGFEPTPFRTGA